VTSGHATNEAVADGKQPASTIGPPRVADLQPPAQPEKSIMPPEAKLETPVGVDVTPTAAVIPVAAAKTSEDPPVLAALRCLLDKRPDEALGRLELYDKSNQELLLFLLPLIVRLTEGGLQQGDPQAMTVLLEELNSLTVPMRARAALTIENICFCKRIEAFGVYDPLPVDYRFRPGDRVRVYLELRNFTSRKCKNAAGETRHVIDLVSTAEIRDYAGNKVAKDIVFERARPDESRALRSDYFDTYQFCVPDIPPGAYTVWIQVEDRGTRPARKARRSLDFRVTNLSVRGS
jgi:hypothetical protein